MAYARIDEGFWTDPKIKALPLEGKMVAAWLFTNPHRHFSGLYYLPIVLIPVEIGLSIGVSTKMLKLLEELGFIKYSHEFSVVWVVNMLRHQSGDKRLSPQQATGIHKQLESLHGCPLIHEFVAKYQSLGVFYNGKIDTPIDTPIDIKSQSQSQSKKKDMPPPEVGGGSYPKDFEAVYAAYPKNRRGSKKNAYKQFKLLNGSIPPNVISVIQRQVGEKKKADSLGIFYPEFKDLERWLKGALWEREPFDFAAERINQGTPEWVREHERRELQEEERKTRQLRERYTRVPQ